MLPIQTLDERKEFVLQKRHIECNCCYCVNDMTDEKLVKDTHPEISELLSKHDINIYTIEYASVLIYKLRKFWDISNNVEDDPMSYDITVLKQRSNQLLRRIAELLTYPCMNFTRGDMPESLALQFIEMNHDIRDYRHYGAPYMTCETCIKCYCEKCRDDDDDEDEEDEEEAKGCDCCHKKEK